MFVGRSDHRLFLAKQMAVYPYGSTTPTGSTGFSTTQQGGTEEVCLMFNQLERNSTHCDAALHDSRQAYTASMASHSSSRVLTTHYDLSWV